MRTLILLGSGEFTKTMDDIDKQLISTYGIKEIAVIPTAAGKERDPEKWIAKAEEHFLPLDVKVTGVKVFTTEDASNNEFVDLLKTPQWICFSGGNPEYLNEALKDSTLWKEIKSKYDNGTVLTGSSAGAMFLGKYILTNPQSIVFGKPNWEEGMGLVNYQIIPHFNMFTRFGGWPILKKLILKKPDFVENKLLGIDEDTALIITDEIHARVMGKGNVYVMINNLETIHKNGDKFDLK